VNRNCQDLFGVSLPDDVLVHFGNNFPRSWDFVKELFGGSAFALLLIQNGLAQLNTLAADVDLTRSFDQRANFAIALSTE
jgi:hypothetical protein